MEEQGAGAPLQDQHQQPAVVGLPSPQMAQMQQNSPQTLGMGINPQAKTHALGTRSMSNPLLAATNPQQAGSTQVQSPSSIPRTMPGMRITAQQSSGVRGVAPLGSSYGAASSLPMPSGMGPMQPQTQQAMLPQRTGQQGQVAPGQQRPIIPTQLHPHIGVSQQSGRGQYQQYNQYATSQQVMRQKQSQAQPGMASYASSAGTTQSPAGVMSGMISQMTRPLAQQQSRMPQVSGRLPMQPQQLQHMSQQQTSPQKLHTQQPSSTIVQASSQQWMQKQNVGAGSYQPMQQQAYPQHSQQFHQQQAHMLQQHQQSLGRAQSPSLQRPVTPTGTQAGTTLAKPSMSGLSTSQPSDAGNRVLGKRSIQELVAQVDPNERLDPEVEDILLEIADDFVESVTTFACKLAKHRKSNVLEVKDVLLHLTRNWDLSIPGFGGEEYRSYKRMPSNEIHRQRLALVKKSLLASQQMSSEPVAAKAPGGQSTNSMVTQTPPTG